MSKFKFLPGIALVVLALAGGILSGCGDDDNPTTTPVTTGAIEGKITDQATGQGVEGVTVTTIPATQSVVTGTDGTFTLSPVTAGQYSVVATKSGILPQSIDVQVIAGSTTRADMILGQPVQPPKITALEFNGTNNMIVAGDAPELDLSGGSFTIEFYAYANAFRNDLGDIWNCTIGHGTSNEDLDYLVAFEKAKPIFHVRNYSAGVKSGTILQENRWYHIAVVQDVEKSKLMIYIDGILDGVATLKGAANTTDGDLFIGARESYGTGKGAHFFDGILYDVRIWNVARTAEQINEMMKTSLTGEETGLVGYWPLNDGSGTTVQDLTAGGNEGLIVGTPVWVEALNPFR